MKNDKPVWMNTAEKLIGTREIVGPKSNPVIMSWAKSLGRLVGIDYTNDDTAWCGIFAGHVVQTHGMTPPKICVRASEWSKFGVRCPLTAFGAIAVFTRKGGGHVGFIVGQDANTLHILGGNQSNSVNVMRIEKGRLTDIRWPSNYPLPAKSVAFTEFDGKISTNES